MYWWLSVCVCAGWVRGWDEEGKGIGGGEDALSGYYKATTPHSPHSLAGWEHNIAIINTIIKDFLSDNWKFGLHVPPLLRSLSPLSYHGRGYRILVNPSLTTAGRHPGSLTLFSLLYTRQELRGNILTNHESLSGNSYTGLAGWWGYQSSQYWNFSTSTVFMIITLQIQLDNIDGYRLTFTKI